MLVTKFRRDSVYVPQNQNVTVYYNYAYPYFGVVTNLYENVALTDSNHKEAPFVLRKTNNGHGTQYVLNILEKSYIGYFVDANEYEVMKANSDTIQLRLLYRDNPIPAIPVRPLDTYYYMTLVRTDYVLGQQEEIPQSQIVLFPNPATNKITVNTPLTEEFKLYNLSGELVLQQKVSGSQMVNIQTLKSGLYHYTLGIKSGKLLIE